MNYFISDLHISHFNIIRYCDRPWTTVDEMDADLIKNWNETVTNEDTVYFLGDFAMSYEMACKVVPMLNGKRKVIILGNHDRNAKDMVAAGFHEAYQSLTIKIGNKTVVLQHRPKPLLGYRQGGWQICGHEHNKTPLIDYEKKIVNVSVENISYKPISETEIIRIMNQ